MTKAYDRLLESPQTSIKRNYLSAVERLQLHVIQITRSSDVPAEYSGSFTPVYYLEGDERAAARRFVEENREQLEAIDFSNPDALQTSLDRELYDWILHELGERKLRKYQTVVYEQRRDGIEWVVEREHFESAPARRYSPNHHSARIDADTPIDELYEGFEETITAAEIASHDAVAGRAEWVLEYYRVAGPYDCTPTTIDGQLALEKQS